MELCPAAKPGCFARTPFSWGALLASCLKPTSSQPPPPATGPRIGRDLILAEKTTPFYTDRPPDRFTKKPIFVPSGTKTVLIPTEAMRPLPGRRVTAAPRIARCLERQTPKSSSSSTGRYGGQYSRAGRLHRDGPLRIVRREVYPSPTETSRRFSSQKKPSRDCELDSPVLPHHCYGPCKKTPLLRGSDPLYARNRIEC